MLGRSRCIRASTLTRVAQQRFGLARALLHWLRTSLNRVRWEENQQFTALERRTSTVPKTAEQAAQLFMATQMTLGENEKARLQRIDQILGTRTHFHDCQLYQERLDSDHVMDIEQLRRENPRPSRRTLDWLNPQAEVKVKYRHKKNYHNMLATLRTYPVHLQGAYDLANQTDQRTIAFLAAETAYSTVSLKPSELSMASLEQEASFLPPQAPLSTALYCYFRPLNATTLFRVPKNLYSPALLTDTAAFQELGGSVEHVVSLQQIYDWLKGYDEDERVHEFLKKIENNRLDYLFADFAVDREERVAAITVDLLGDGRQHCVFVKSLSSKQKLIPRPLLNLRPTVRFSADSSTLYFVQRSPEGGWIELGARPVSSCWALGDSAALETIQDPSILYRCSPQKEMRLGSDSQNNLVFLTVSEYGQEFSESLHLVSLGEEGIRILTLDEDQRCQYYYDLVELGVVFGRKRAVDSKLKYGENQCFIQSLQLVPFKQHIVEAGGVGLSDLRLPGQTSKPVVSPDQLDLAAKRTIFLPEKDQFIRSVQARSSHIVMIIDFFSVYDRNILYFLPLKPNAHPHSLILKAGARLKLGKSEGFQSQLVQFTQPRGLLDVQKVYNIWKRQLREEENQAMQYHQQSITITSDDYQFDIQILCKSLYLSEKKLPVVLVVSSNSESIDQSILRQLLQKGVMVVLFGGRGTQTKDLQHYLSGNRNNFGNMLDDLQATVEFIGNEMTQNISLYCKGEVSSLVGLWFNFYFPYLFNASVLHNGLYNLTDALALAPFQDFFGQIPEEGAEPAQGFDFKKFNMFGYKFRTLGVRDQSDQKKEYSLGAIQNVIISSDTNHRLHSRQLIKRLRENQFMHYNEVYLKEYEDRYQADLCNIGYLYHLLKERMERERSRPDSEDDSEDD